MCWKPLWLFVWTSSYMFHINAMNFSLQLLTPHNTSSALLRCTAACSDPSALHVEMFPCFNTPDSNACLIVRCLKKLYGMLQGWSLTLKERLWAEKTLTCWQLSVPKTWINNQSSLGLFGVKEGHTCVHETDSVAAQAEKEMPESYFFKSKSDPFYGLF